MIPGPDRLGYEAQAGCRVSTGQMMLNRSGTCSALIGLRAAALLNRFAAVVVRFLRARLDAGALDRLGELGVESLPADLMPGG